MIDNESFPIFMWLSLTEFTDYSETVFSNDNHWVFPYKASLYYHTRSVVFFSVRSFICALFFKRRGALCRITCPYPVIFLYETD